VDRLVASYIQIYIYFGVVRLGISKGWQVLSGGSLGTTTGDFCPFFNYRRGVKEIGGKRGVPAFVGKGQGGGYMPESKPQGLKPLS
jgi:hypothetical protein